jgi:hypothetical protein
MENTVQFSPSAQPSVNPGVYCVNIKQILEKDCVIEKFNLNDANINISFSGDQISLNKNEVYSVYPPADSIGNFTCCLPHMVFHRKTLPWNRKLKSVNGTDFSDMSYIALLVVSEKEGVEEITLKYSELQTTPLNVYRPHIDDSLIDGDQICTVIDIPKSLWADILPYSEDLPYLAHIKGVDLSNKVTDKEVSGGWFSCLIANRYPDELGFGEDNLKHTVYLVSLEGFENFLILSPQERAEKCKSDYIRMFALYSYSFYVQPNSYDFYTIASDMKAGTFFAEGIEPPSDILKNIIELGYVPVDHNFRDGSSLVSWYRSPFLPGAIGFDEKISYCFCSDQLLRYDPEQGMFDITYSAAWQLGRMLSLQNTELAGNILAWRLYNKNEAVKVQTFKMLSKLVNDSLNKSDGNELHIMADYPHKPSSTNIRAANSNNDQEQVLNSTEALTNHIWKAAINGLHKGCNSLSDSIGIKGNGVRTFSKNKALKLAAANSNGVSTKINQTDLLKEEE